MLPLTPEHLHRCREVLQLEEVARPGFRLTPAAKPKAELDTRELWPHFVVVAFCHCELCNHVRRALWAEADAMNDAIEHVRRGLRPVVVAELEPALV
ncbi:MAG TPA: hypothetical protein VFX29_01845 [Longimicrobiaceae bacterium]|nr:hypothetical protein [Longimicrobiaceae bacterium]